MSDENTCVLLVNLWLIGSFLAPASTGGKSIWAYPKELMLAVAALWLIVLVFS